ncbi:MAG: hypothetical protein ACT4PV_02245 [Planctomycetaceae bacterium]
MPRALTALLSFASLALPAAAGSLDEWEKATREGVEAELLRLAATLGSAGAFEEAAEEMRRCLSLVPTSEKAREELARLAGKEGRGAGGGARRTSHATCAALLARFAQEAAKAGELERAWLAWTDARLLGDRAPDLVWYAPYGLVVREQDRLRLDAGREFLDGRWRTRDEVERLDALHDAFAHPWILERDGTVVETTMPLRTARQVLFHAVSFRRHLIAQFAGEWDLRAPEGRLPILVARTQEEFQELATLHGGPDGSGNPRVAAYYLWSSNPLNPCLVTFQPIDSGTGRPLSIGFEQLAFTLRHELAHQVFFEYSRHKAPRPRPVAHHFWAVEGLAEFCSNFTLSEQGWRLAYLRRVPLGRGFFEANFAHCKAHFASLPSLEAFFAMPKEEFTTMAHYHQGATTSAFLLHSPRWRGPFLRLAEAVHQGGAAPGAWYRAEELASMQKEWAAYVAALALEGDAPGK